MVKYILFAFLTTFKYTIKFTGINYIHNAVQQSSLFTKLLQQKHY